MIDWHCKKFEMQQAVTDIGFGLPSKILILDFPYLGSYLQDLLPAAKRQGQTELQVEKKKETYGF